MELDAWSKSSLGEADADAARLTPARVLTVSAVFKTTR